MIQDSPADAVLRFASRQGQNKGKIQKSVASVNQVSARGSEVESLKMVLELRLGAWELGDGLVPPNTDGRPPTTAHRTPKSGVRMGDGFVCFGFLWRVGGKAERERRDRQRVTGEIRG